MPSRNGKFILYASAFSEQNERLTTVGQAVARIAENLGAEIEIVQRMNVLSIFVYYKKGGREEVPVYCDWGKNLSVDDVYYSVWSVVYALSFHPEYTFLQTIRKR